MSDFTGHRFNKYRIEAEIGSGGFGSVWRAVDTSLDRPVAIKVLDPLLTRDPGWVARFQKEARLMARLDHPHIVPVYETGEELGRLFIVMKLVEGPDLAQRLKASGAFEWAELVQFVADIAGALDYAHKNNVVHRDLKPGNIILGSEGPVLTDFGFARLVGDHSLSASMSGGVVGTPAYIAPEIWEGKPADRGADIYALACILYEMATGRALFGGETTPAIMMAHFQPLELPEEWPENVPPGLGPLLETGLRRDPAERYATAGQLAQALEQLRIDRLAEPYAALQAAVAAEEWGRALELAGEIRSEQPDYRDIVALEAAALAGQERLQRAAWAVEWRKQATSALARGNLEAARIAALRWQEMAADKRDAQLFLARLETQAGAEVQGTAEAGQPTPYEQLLLRERVRAEMQALIEHEEWEAACVYAESVLAETPDNQVAAMWKRAAIKLEERAALKVESQRPPNQLTSSPRPATSREPDNPRQGVVSTSNRSGKEQMSPAPRYGLTWWWKELTRDVFTLLAVIYLVFFLVLLVAVVLNQF